MASLVYPWLQLMHIKYPSTLRVFPFPLGFSIIIDFSDHGRHLLRPETHVIETTGWSVFAKTRWLDPEKLRIAAVWFQDLEKAGGIRRSDSPWALPLHMVPKKYGSCRSCGDYWSLNNITTYDRYPLPNILDVSVTLHGCTVFSKIDLVKGYHQIPVALAGIRFSNHSAFFRFSKCRSVKNDAQSFQRIVDTVFRGVTFVLK